MHKNREKYAIVNNMKTYHVHAIKNVGKNLHATTKTLKLHYTSVTHQLTSYKIKNNDY
jgi:hypothetical protein